MQDARQTLLVPHCGSVGQQSSQIVSFSCLSNTSVLSQPIAILQPRQGQGRPYDVDLRGRAAAAIRTLEAGHMDFFGLWRARLRTKNLLSDPGPQAEALEACVCALWRQFCQQSSSFTSWRRLAIAVARPVRSFFGLS
ncbi:unnamed protein product [Ectocarpus sp. 12 AP-2014]